MEKLEKERDAIPLDEIQTGRNVELLSLMKTTTQKNKKCIQRIECTNKNYEKPEKSHSKRCLHNHCRPGRPDIGNVGNGVRSRRTCRVRLQYLSDYQAKTMSTVVTCLDCGDTVTDTELNQWCMVEEKDGSHTIWRIVGHHCQTFLNCSIRNGKTMVDSNPNWTNSKHKKKREIELTSKKRYRTGWLWMLFIRTK